MKIDTNKVRIGMIENFKPSAMEGRRRSGGFGFIRGQGRNAGTAFALLGDFVGIEYRESEFCLTTHGVAESGNFGRNDEVVLALVEPTPDRGPKAAWWARKASWDAALRKRREHVLTRHANNGDNTVIEVQFFIDLDGTEYEVGRQALPVREEMKFHDSSYWAPRAEEFDDGLWLVQHRTPNYEFLRTQIRTVTELPTGTVTKFELYRGVDGWVPAPVERRFRPTSVWTEPAGYQSGSPSREDLAKVFHSGYPEWKIKAKGIDPGGSEVVADLACPSKATVTESYIRKDSWPWSEVPLELKLQYYLSWPVCTCRKARYHRAAGEMMCSTCAQRAKYGTCACGRPGSEWGKAGEKYFCNFSDCAAGKLPKALEVLQKTLLASGNEELRRLQTVAMRVAEEAKRLLESTTVVTGVDEVRGWLEAKAQELIPEDVYWGDGKRRRLVDATRREYSHSNPVAVVELEDGYYASHLPKGLLHRCAKLAEMGEAQAIQTLACIVSSQYADRVLQSQRRQKMGPVAENKQKANPRATRVSPQPKFEFPGLTADSWRWLVYCLERGEPVIAKFFAASEDFRQKTRELVEAAATNVTRLKDEYGREANLATFCTEELEKANRFLQETEFAKARTEAQKVQDACAAKEAELDARRAEQSRGEVWLNVRVSISTESRTTTRAWAILPDGSIMEPVTKENSGGRKGRVFAYVYGDLPTNILVISHEDDNYGYRKSERWQVCYLPKLVTVQQHETVRHLLDDSRVYFSGRQAGWDLSHVGNVTVTTSYSRDLMGEEREMYDAMCSSYPIDLSEWQVGEEHHDVESVTYVVEHRPRRPVTPRPSVVRATETLYSARAEQQVAAESAPEDGQMEEAGNRHFRCLTSGCGRMEKVGKGDWQAYQSGQSLTITCAACGKTATVQKEKK